MNERFPSYVVIAAALLCAVAGIATAATVTQSISYQGRLTDQYGNPENGDRAFTFLLWDAESGGNLLYDTPSQTVHCDNGLFSSSIPFPASYFDGRALWLGIQVSGGDEMSPRQEIRPVPYALSIRPGALIRNSLASTALSIESLAANSDGVSIKRTADHGSGLIVNTTQSSSPGILVTTWQSLSEGISSVTYGGNSPAVYAWSEDDYGIHAHSKYSHAIYADTESASSYGVYTPDRIYAGGSSFPTADVAEFMPVTEDVTPGTVMIIGDDGKLQVSNTAYDTRVAGMVSTSPGVSLGTKENGNPGEEQIAIAGRVPCKVDARYGAIHPGDVLTTSPNPGHAMKGTG